MYVAPIKRTVLVFFIAALALGFGARPMPAHAQVAGLPVVGVWSTDYNSSNITDTSLTSSVRIEINVTGAPSFTGFEFYLFYDPAVLAAASVDYFTGSPCPQPNLVTQELTPLGTVRLVVINLGQVPCGAGDSVLTHITFSIIKTGVSPLVLAAGTATPADSAKSWTRLVIEDPLSPGDIVPIAVDTSNGYFRNQVTQSDEVLLLGSAPPVGTALETDPKLKYIDSNSNSRWDGESVVYDANNDGFYQTTDSLISGPQPLPGTTLETDPKMKFVDDNNSNTWDSLEAVLYEPDNNGVFDINLGPQAGFTFDPPAPIQGDTITFDASSSFDADNQAGTNKGIVSYLWDFGDGSSSNTNTPTVTHRYVTFTTTLYGNFSVRLTVVDGDNFLGMAVRLVGVTVKPFHDVLVFSLTARPENANPGQKVNITVIVINKGTYDERFNLTLSYTAPFTPLGDKLGEDVVPQEVKTYVFEMDTSGLAGVYTVEAQASIQVDDVPSNNRRTTIVSVLELGSPVSLYFVGGAFGAAAAIVTVGILLRRRRRPKETE